MTGEEIQAYVNEKHSNLKLDVRMSRGTHDVVAFGRIGYVVNVGYEENIKVFDARLIESLKKVKRLVTLSLQELGEEDAEEKERRNEKDDGGVHED